MDTQTSNNFNIELEEMIQTKQSVSEFTKIITDFISPDSQLQGHNMDQPEEEKDQGEEVENMEEDSYRVGGQAQSLDTHPNGQQVT